nr:MAG TPA: monocytogenes binding protein [Caudoviricetes sp.]
MKKQEVLEYAKTCNFKLEKEVKDLSGNTFFSLKNETTDLTLIYRDQKDGNFFLMGLYPFGKTEKLMELLKNRK